MKRNTAPVTDSATVFTIGHSTRTLAEFVTLLRALARDDRCAIMCSEAVWWRCHRRIITDYLLAGGTRVEHIMGPGQVVPATLTPGACLMVDGTLRYPASEDDEEPASGD